MTTEQEAKLRYDAAGNRMDSALENEWEGMDHGGGTPCGDELEFYAAIREQDEARESYIAVVTSPQVKAKLEADARLSAERFQPPGGTGKCFAVLFAALVLAVVFL
jgi:hypothetical protein